MAKRIPKITTLSKVQQEIAQSHETRIPSEIFGACVFLPNCYNLAVCAVQIAGRGRH